MATLVDYSAGVPKALAILEAGHAGAVRYVSPSRAEWMVGKPLHRREAEALGALGLSVVSNWQYGKGNTADWRRGFAGGVKDAREADQIHAVAGGPAHAPIFFSIDDDISLADWNALAADYLRGAASVIGLSRVGMYGHSRAGAWAIEDGVVGKSSTPGKYWIWQTRAWSKGVILKEAVMYQNVIDTVSAPGPVIDGVTVDVSEIRAADYGQWDRLEQEHQGGFVSGKPEFTEHVRLTGGSSSRHGARVNNAFIHTEQGNGSAESLANYCSNLANQVSYHYTVRDRIVFSIVDTNRAAWSVLNKNPSSINLCFAGSYAEWSREEWLRREDDIAIAAWLLVEDAKKHSFSSAVIAPPYRRGDGISDHRYVTQVLGMGTHWDVGDGFPWDVFAGYVSQYVAGVPQIPNIKAIDVAAAQTPWLGGRIDPDEQATPDGIGRYSQFTEGFVYWTPETGAVAIPTHLFDAWAQYEWETGPLGYPISGHSVLSEDGVNVGDVQAFQGGVLYRKYGQEGYYVLGVIGARWARDGYENGPLGWPQSLEVPAGTDGEARMQRFEHGRLIWDPSGAVEILEDK